MLDIILYLLEYLAFRRKLQLSMMVFIIIISSIYPISLLSNGI